MKFFYKTVYYADGSRPQYDKHSVSEFCCREMGEAHNEDLITLGDDYNTSTKVCINSKEVCGYDYYDRHTPINFCPFCGEKLEAGEAGRVNRKRVEKEVVHKQSEWVDEPL
jgi:hypothetical protein